METEVCIGPDVELSERKKPPPHCIVSREKSAETHTVLKLEIKRTRKEGNATLKTISDFRKYICKVDKGDQHGSASVQLTGMFLPHGRCFKCQRLTATIIFLKKVLPKAGTLEQFDDNESVGKVFYLHIRIQFKVTGTELGDEES